MQKVCYPFQINQALIIFMFSDKTQKSRNQQRSTITRQDLLQIVEEVVICENPPHITIQSNHKNASMCQPLIELRTCIVY